MYISSEDDNLVIVETVLFSERSKKIEQLNESGLIQEICVLNRA